MSIAKSSIAKSSIAKSSIAKSSIAKSLGAGTSSAPVVRCERVTKTYGVRDTAVTALDDVTVSFAAGHLSVIMGPSGSGKSTLMHCMAGLDRISSGAVYLGSECISALSERALTRVRRDHIGFVFQSFNLVPTLSARENITLPGDLAGRRVDTAWLDEVVSAVGIGDRLVHRPSELSGGQQQRVAVARALASRPEIIFADEPTGNLDSRSGHDVLALLRRCVDELGQSIVMVTHDPVAAAWGDRVVFLTDGSVSAELDDPTASGVLEHMGATD